MDRLAGDAPVSIEVSNATGRVYNPHWRHPVFVIRWLNGDDQESKYISTGLRYFRLALV